MNDLDYRIPHIPDRLKKLGDLSYNFWFSWHWEALSLFAALDEKLWEDVSFNPVKLLQQIGEKRLEEIAADGAFLQKYDSVISVFEHYMTDRETWYHSTYPRQKDAMIAYFSLEFGIHESFPIYSGGMGILAGDHLKSASDLGIPLVGVGLLYRQSYFTQLVSLHGHQQALYLDNDFSALPILPVKNKNGDRLIIRIKLDHSHIAARVWQANVGRTSLYLLDTDFPENVREDRKITQRLYVPDRDLRLIQELLLGVGGTAVLKTLGLSPAVWHMNEGHCSFLGIERIRQKIEGGFAFEKAREHVRGSSVFTTHTPVPAGNEVFEIERVARLLGSYWESLGLSREAFFALAQEKDSADTNNFNMTILALRLAKYANGVSRLHGDVARKMWHSIWPERPIEEVPIISITNGVHVRSWMTRQIKVLLDKHLTQRWRCELAKPSFWDAICDIPDGELWIVRQELKSALLEKVRKRLIKQRERNGESMVAINEASKILNPNVLTIGFARRFAPYKRGTLILQNRQWLQYILTREDTPVQILFAGKAHPENQAGKALIREVYEESRKPEYRGRIVFVENYDMAIARRLVSGVDVWLNTPRRPYEASGTSGMKAAANGGLNLSILDGWWQEAYNGKNGWAIGEGEKYTAEGDQDRADNQSLCRILEEEVIPLFYERDEKGLPRRWIQMMKASMQSIVPRFNTYRMVQEYMTEMYAPAMENQGEEIQFEM